MGYSQEDGYAKSSPLTRVTHNKRLVPPTTSKVSLLTEWHLLLYLVYHYEMSDKPYDQDDDGERMIPIDLPPPQSLPNIFQVMSYMIEADRRDALVNETVRDYLDELIDDFGDECVIPIISYIQQYMGWDMEILLEQSDVENFLMKNHSLFDEDMWLKVLNTKAINEFHSAVFRLSQTYLSDAVSEVLMKEELRTAGEDAPPE